MVVMMCFFVYICCWCIQMTGYLLDDSRIMETDSEKKQKVDKVFSDVEQLLKESTLSER